MPAAGFEPAIPAGERQQTHALGRTDTGIGLKPKYRYVTIWNQSFWLPPPRRKDSSPDAMLLISNSGSAAASETNTIHSYSPLSVYVLPSLLLLEIQSACNTSWWWKPNRKFRTSSWIYDVVVLPTHRGRFPITIFFRFPHCRKSTDVPAGGQWVPSPKRMFFEMKV